MTKAEKRAKKIEENEKRINNKVNAIIFPSFVDEKHKDGFIKLKNINKIYDNNMQAVFDFNLNIQEREFVVFVGPSGCGKSTTLRMICGLEDISNGALFIDGKYANELHPKDRDVAMVFQSYALYPHMSVHDNIAFSLQIRKIPVAVLDENGKQVCEIDKTKAKALNRRIKELKDILKEDQVALDLLEKRKDEYNKDHHDELVSYYNERNELVNKEIEKKTNELNNVLSTPAPKYVFKHMKKDEIERKVNEAAKILQIEQFLLRKPKALSGGQRQRVALGRSIVRDAKVFLMDEPLSNLDAKLRVAMRSEIVALHRKINATTIYVTHDQTEAMTMADRIVVMKDGVIQQIGSPRNIYSHPSNLFVATFIGSPAMNVISATYTKEGIKVSDDVILKTIDDFDPLVFYKKELDRYAELKAKLKKALLNKEDKNTLIYERAIKKVEHLEDVFNSRKDCKFPIIYGIRPEHIAVVGENENADATIKAEIVELLGSEYYIHSHIGNSPIVVKCVNNDNIETGDTIRIKFDISKSHYFDIETEQSLND